MRNNISDDHTRASGRKNKLANKVTVLRPWVGQPNSLSAYAVKRPLSNRFSKARHRRRGFSSRLAFRFDSFYLVKAEAVLSKLERSGFRGLQNLYIRGPARISRCRNRFWWRTRRRDGLKTARFWKARCPLSAKKTSQVSLRRT